MKLKDYAIDILKQYAEENGIMQRSTSDLSPFEIWLISKLYNNVIRTKDIVNKSKSIPKDIQEIVNNNWNELINESYKEAK